MASPEFVRSAAVPAARSNDCGARAANGSQRPLCEPNVLQSSGCRAEVQHRVSVPSALRYHCRFLPTKLFASRLSHSLSVRLARPNGSPCIINSSFASVRLPMPSRKRIECSRRPILVRRKTERERFAHVSPSVNSPRHCFRHEKENGFPLQPRKRLLLAFTLFRIILRLELHEIARIALLFAAFCCWFSAASFMTFVLIAFRVLGAQGLSAARRTSK